LNLKKNRRFIGGNQVVKTTFSIFVPPYFNHRNFKKIMALGTFIYLRNVNNLSDARYAAGMGVDLIGFNFSPDDPEALNFEKFKEISEWISGVKIVGEFGKSSAEEVNKKIESVEPDYLLISDESQINNFTSIGIPLIMQINIDQLTKDETASTLNFCSGSVDYFLFESDQENIREPELIREFARKYPILLGSGITGENVKSFTEELNLAGISLKGGSEIRPGYKEFDEMADILEALETD
jgi:phosphoribosylanthranilate isomerase